MKFVKMEGCGNDYVYINGFEEKPDNKEELVRFLSERHFGIGSDGVIFINPSEIADFEMEMWNADGTRAEMCGNGIRCVAKYVYDFGMTDKTTFTIESFGKIKIIQVFLKNNKVDMVRVDMGEPELRSELVPIESSSLRVVDEPLEVDGHIYHITGVSMGNPHAVTFLDSRFPLENAALDTLNLEAIGPSFEHHVRFPKRINAEFVEVVDREHVRMRVWERGTGETLCCGTGCCATAVACILNGLTDNRVSVEVIGGTVVIEWNRENNHIFMTGPARISFTGEINL